MKISVVVAGVGLRCMEDCLKSFNPWPDEMIVAIDDVGNSHLPEARRPDEWDVWLRDNCPQSKVIHNRNFDNWLMANQTANMGYEAASNDWVLFTHEDTTFNGYPYLAEYSRILDVLQKQGFQVEGKAIIGVMFPYEENGVPNMHETWPVIANSNTSMSTVFSRQSWLDIGKFDLVHGFFYDYHMLAEMRLRDWFVYVAPVPPVHHVPARSYHAVNTLSPQMAPYMALWNGYHTEFPKVYGEDHFAFHANRERGFAVEAL